MYLTDIILYRGVSTGRANLVDTPGVTSVCNPVASGWTPGCTANVLSYDHVSL